MRSVSTPMAYRQQAGMIILGKRADTPYVHMTINQPNCCTVNIILIILFKKTIKHSAYCMHVVECCFFNVPECSMYDEHH